MTTPNSDIDFIYALKDTYFLPFLSLSTFFSFLFLKNPKSCPISNPGIESISAVTYSAISDSPSDSPPSESSGSPSTICYISTVTLNSPSAI